ncbi:MAG: hypothetical protein HY327_06240 [Chloroflexi bacterium]|nr:hypothetical protein [Chloroflexota bacterium]
MFNLSSEASAESSSLELAAEIAALLQAGCEIHITPSNSMYGVVYFQVRVTAPSSTPRRSPQDELKSASDGALMSFPLVRRFHLIEEISELAPWLRKARFLLARPLEDNPDAPTESN